MFLTFMLLLLTLLKVALPFNHGPQTHLEIETHEKELILYLEPEQNEPIRDDILKLMQEAKNKLGPNEAHQYFPHVSLISFLKVQDENAIIKAVDDIMKDQSKVNFTPTKLQLSGSKSAVSINLIVKDNIGKMLANRINEIVPKNADHLSIGYFIAYNNVAKSYRMDELLKLSKTFLKIDANNNLKSYQNTKWCITLQQRIKKSSDLNIPHEFVELKRWQVLNESNESVASLKMHSNVVLVIILIGILLYDALNK